MVDNKRDKISTHLSNDQRTSIKEAEQDGRSYCGICKTWMIMIHEISRIYITIY